MSNRMMRWFDCSHLPTDLKTASLNCQNLAKMIDSEIPDCAEKTAGLRKLLEAKDCFVRAVIETRLEE